MLYGHFRDLVSQVLSTLVRAIRNRQYSHLTSPGQSWKPYALSWLATEVRCRRRNGMRAARKAAF